MKGAGPLRPYVLGIDESGTGAYAGPFTVCGFMSRREDTPWIREIGARDSKACSRTARWKLADELAPAAVIAEIVPVPHDYTDQRQAWRGGVLKAIEHCISAIEYNPSLVSVFIDGSEDLDLAKVMRAQWGITPFFQVRADSLIPQVSAASIYAKTTRSAIMMQLHDLFPVYGWERNDGYGTVDHRAAIEVHGICEWHRRVRPLMKYFDPQVAALEQKREAERRKRDELQDIERESARFNREHGHGDK